MDAEQRRSMAADLEATVEVRKELDPAYEPALVEAFLERIDEQVEKRVKEEVKRRRREEASSGYVFPLAIVSLGTGIPITAIAGGVADLPGLVVAWAGIVSVNAVFAFSQRRHLRRRD